MSGQRVQLLLDSGAYSAWTTRQSLDLGEYIDFVKRNEPWLSAYVNLDVIPRKRTADDVRTSAKQSYRNWVFMKRAGLNPMPVFHWGETFNWLRYMLEDGCDHLRISAPKHGPVERQWEWLDRVFDVLGGANSVVRVHGFAITTPESLLRYPFASVDSTTWALSAGYGKILVPRRGADGGFDYSRPPEGVIISGERQGTLGRNAQRFEILDRAMQDWAETYLASLGVTAFEARYAPGARRYVMVRFFQELAEQLGVTIYYATRLDPAFAEVLTKCGANTRLLSYAELKDRPDAVLRSYVETGLVERKLAPRRWRVPGCWRDPAYRSQRALGLARRHGLILQAHEKVWA